jgi:hypothetical protein
MFEKPEFLFPDTGFKAFFVDSPEKIFLYGTVLLFYSGYRLYIKLTIS